MATTRVARCWSSRRRGRPRRARAGRTRRSAGIRAATVDGAADAGGCLRRASPGTYRGRPRIPTFRTVPHPLSRLGAPRPRRPRATLKSLTPGGPSGRMRGMAEIAVTSRWTEGWERVRRSTSSPSATRGRGKAPNRTGPSSRWTAPWSPPSTAPTRASRRRTPSTCPVPGGRLPVAGLTWVGVLPTHRRGGPDRDDARPPRRAQRGRRGRRRPLRRRAGHLRPLRLRPGVHAV